MRLKIERSGRSGFNTEPEIENEFVQTFDFEKANVDQITFDEKRYDQFSQDPSQKKNEN